MSEEEAAKKEVEKPDLTVAEEPTVEAAVAPLESVIGPTPEASTPEIVSEEIVEEVEEEEVEEEIDLRTKTRNVCLDLMKETLDKEIDEELIAMARVKIKKILLQVLEEEASNMAPVPAPAEKKKAAPAPAKKPKAA